MSKLSAIFSSIQATLHWGPSVEPFHKAVIEEHDALQDRVKALEDQVAADKSMMDMVREDYARHMANRSSFEEPEYITEETAAVQVAQAAVEALAGGPDDTGSIVDDQNPVEPEQKPVADLLGASPAPVPSGPDEAPADPETPPDAEVPAETSQDPVTE